MVGSKNGGQKTRGGEPVYRITSHAPQDTREKADPPPLAREVALMQKFVIVIHFVDVASVMRVRRGAAEHAD